MSLNEILVNRRVRVCLDDLDDYSDLDIPFGDRGRIKGWRESNETFHFSIDADGGVCRSVKPLKTFGFVSFYNFTQFWSDEDFEDLCFIRMYGIRTDLHCSIVGSYFQLNL
jgi:hypothetical protein